MKITILQGAFFPVPPVLGGAVEKIWYVLGKNFANLGHEVIHISRLYDGQVNEELIDGVLHKRIEGYDTPSSLLYLKWLDLLYSKRAVKTVPDDSDIIVTHTFWAPLLLSPRLKKRCMVSVERMPKGQMKLYRRSGRLRANSSTVAEAIRRETRKQNDQRVVMIPNSLPFQIWPAEDLSQKKNVLLYVGRVHPEKGLETLVHAFKKIESNWKLQIVGPWQTGEGGGGAAYFESLKKIAGDADIEFKGPVFDMEKLNQLYKEASIFTYPSVAEQGETFGLAPLEAMAWGCVPVVSNLACFQDFIKNRDNGLVFDHRAGDAVDKLKNSIIYLQQNRSIRFEMAQEALHVRHTHSAPYIASLFIEEFKQMIH